jgi:amino acid permease
MSTTSLFVEILVVGIQTLVWLVLLIHAQWDLKPFLDMLKEYKEYAALITTLLLALAYVLGIFIDRIADSLCRWLRYSSDQLLPESVGKIRLRIMKESEGMAKFLDYQRSRLRIARATVFNMFVVIVLISIWMFWHRSADPGLMISVIGGGVVTFAIAVAAMRSIDKAQMDRLIDAYRIITEKKGE